MCDGIQRYWCWTKPSMVQNYKNQNDNKWVIENGIEVVRRRSNQDNVIRDGFGRLISGIQWNETNVYIVLKETSFNDNQDETGEVNFAQKDIIKCYTSSNYDIRVNDIIVISTIYLIIYDNNENVEFTYWKVKQIKNDSFNYGTPNLPMLILERRASVDAYEN